MLHMYTQTGITMSQTIGNCVEHQHSFWRFGNTSNTIFLHMCLAEFVISYKPNNLAQNVYNTCNAKSTQRSNSCRNTQALGPVVAMLLGDTICPQLLSSLVAKAKMVSLLLCIPAAVAGTFPALS